MIKRYLSKLLHWFGCLGGLAVFPAAFTMTYPFPTSLAFSQAELSRRFGIVTVEQDPDPAIHYKLTIPLKWRQVTGTRRLVTPAHPFELRSHFKATVPPEAEVKVWVAYVAQELSPSDWLAIYLRGQHETVVHERHLPQKGGAIPDVLTKGGAPGHERISRWLVLKDHAHGGGSHLYVVQASTAAATYTTDMANVFLLLVSGFDLLHPVGWLHAEQLRTLARSTPLKFTTAFPLSWQLIENPASDEHFYQCKLLKDTANSRMSLALLSGQTEQTLRRLVAEDQAALAAAGLVFEPAALAAGTSVGPLQHVLTATTVQQSAGPVQPAHEREVVLSQLGPEEWLYADRIAPTQAAAPQEWAVSRQAFAILLEELRLG